MLKMKAERLKRGWRQEDLAFYTRMAAADISRIETGRLRPYPSQVARLEQVLGIPAEELLTIMEPMPSQGSQVRE
jgi:transcriptional regulator with XRE-family HTH domain